MTVKKIIVLACMLTAGLSVNGQIIYGKWYAINRSGLIEFDITADTLRMQSLSLDMEPKGHDVEKLSIMGIHKIDERLLIIFPDKKDVTKFRAMTIFNVRPRESLEIAANGVNTSSESSEHLIEATKKDTTKLFGNLIFNEHFLPTLRAMKSVTLMDIQDFKTFLQIYISKREGEFRNAPENMAGTQTYQLTIRTLVGMGYNPINSVDYINELFEKFLLDPEVKALLEKI